MAEACSASRVITGASFEQRLLDAYGQVGLRKQPAFRGLSGPGCLMAYTCTAVLAAVTRQHFLGFAKPTIVVED